MKLSFNLSKKEASFEADIEKLATKGMEQKAKNPERKTRYQIKQEEKRKNKELEHKHFIQGILLMMGILLFSLILCFIGASLGI